CRAVREERAGQCAAAAGRFRSARQPEDQGARQDAAAAAAELLRRLPRAADLRGHEARAAGAWAAPDCRRYRLPSVREPAAVQYRPPPHLHLPSTPILPPL